MTSKRKLSAGLVRLLGAALSLAALSLAPLSLAAQPIVVAHIGPFSGPTADDARGLNQGIKAHLDELNRAGGLGGRKLELLSADDKYDGDEFARQLESVMLRKPVALLSPLGPNALRKVFSASLLDQHDITVINAVPGATPFRSPGHPRLFHVRAGDRKQVEKMLRHCLVLGLTRVQVLMQSDRLGAADVEAARLALPESAGLSVQIREADLKPGVIPSVAADMARAGVQAVLVLGPPPYMAQVIAELRQAGVSSMVFALSYLPPGLVVKLAGLQAARGVSIVQTFPSPMGQNLPLQRRFQAAMKASAPELAAYTAFQLEGYVTARVLTEALRNASGPLSPASVAASLQRLGAMDLGGFWLDFGKSNAGGNFVDIAVIDPTGRLRY